MHPIHWNYTPNSIQLNIFLFYRDAIDLKEALEFGYTIADVFGLNHDLKRHLIAL